ncbi:hypothetical protein PG988_003439 [Apiospora saccharicola]
MKVLPIAFSLLATLAAAGPVNPHLPRYHRDVGFYYTTWYTGGDEKVYRMTFAEKNPDFCHLTEGPVARIDVFPDFECTLYMNGTATRIQVHQPPSPK